MKYIQRILNNNDLWISNGKLSDSEGYIYLWVPSNSIQANMLDTAVGLSDYETYMLNAGITDIDTVNQTLYKITWDTRYILFRHTQTEYSIELNPSMLPASPDIPANFDQVNEAAVEVYNNAVLAFLHGRNRGFFSIDQGPLLALYAGIFIPKGDHGDEYYGHYLTIDRISKFYDLNQYELEDNSLIMITYNNDHSILFTDLTDGSDPDIGLIIENKTITSSKIIKRLDIYYENTDPSQLR